MSEPLIPAAQVFKRYLHPTHNWIYEQFRVLRHFKPVVLAYKMRGLEQFPVERSFAVRSGNPLRQARDHLCRRLLGYYPTFAAAVRAENALLLHAHFGDRGVASLQLARVLRLPLLVSFYGRDLWRDDGNAARLQARYAPLFEQCTFAIVEGPVARRRLIELGCPEAKARIHPLGVDLSRLRYSDRPKNTNVRVLAAARFTEKKGLIYGVEAFCRAAAEDPRLQLTVVGDAKKTWAEQRIKTSLHDLVKASRMSARVRFLGKVSPDELRALLYEHDVLLHPSVRAADGDAEGGLPVIMLEAAASGMPLIGSRHCDIPEIVVDGQTGWLCEERDVAGLTTTLLSAARDPIQRARLGRNARERAEQRFDINQHTWDALYRQALGQGPGIGDEYPASTSPVRRPGLRPRSLVDKAAGATSNRRMLRIAFLAISQAHQFLHWLPAALRLAREPGVEVTILGASAAGLEFIRSYDADGLLRIRKLWVPSRRRDGLFTPPKRRLTLLMHFREIGRYPVIVTTATTSSLLYRLPGFSSRIVHLKHGAGDREGSYSPKHKYFDLTLVNGPKHKAALIARGLRNESNCLVVGNAKFELVRPTQTAVTANRTALYNPHFDKRLSTWFGHGPTIVRTMEHIEGWTFVVAPHVKLKGGPTVQSTAPNVSIDMGSVHSIDMTYTNEASVYIGDVSSQVYEFLRHPRPCIFLNFDRIAWQGNDNYAHWTLGQVIEHPQDLARALERAYDLQSSFEGAQIAASVRSIDPSPELASERQARAILAFARGEHIRGS